MSNTAKLDCGQSIGSEQYWAVLSFLRFVLAASVLLGHIGAFRYNDMWQYGVGGVQAVGGFFIISGFSIAHSLRSRPHGFFRRRVIRIYPLSVLSIFYALLVFAIVGMMPLVDGSHLPHLDLIGILSSLLLLNGIVEPTPFLFGPLWSLNCEILYYILAPFLLRLSKYICIILILFSAVLFLPRIVNDDVSAAQYGMAILRMFWLWMLGFLAYSISIGAGTTALVAIAATMMFLPVHHAPLGAIIFGVVLPWLAVATFTRLAVPRRLVAVANYLGDLSYPMYVLQLPTIFLVLFCLGTPGPSWTGFLCFGLIIGLSVIAYHGIDRPVRAYLSERH